MPLTVCACATARPDAAVLNDAIRALCAGRTVWPAGDLVELARLRAQWQAAVAEEQRAA